MADYASPKWKAALNTGKPAPKKRYVLWFDDGHVEIFTRPHDRAAHVAKLTAEGKDHHIVRHEVVQFRQS